MALRFPRHEKKRTSMCYMVTGAFAVVLILAAIFVLRSPSQDDVENSSVVASETHDQQQVPPTNPPPKDEQEEINKKQDEIQREIDADDEDPQGDEHKAPPQEEQDPEDNDDEDEKPKDNVEDNPAESPSKEVESPEQQVESPSPKEDIPKPKEEQIPEEVLSPQEQELAANQTELLVENKEITSANWTSQANESRIEKKEEPGLADIKKNEASETASEIYDWKLCNFGGAADYIPCLDNRNAIKKLKSTKHYEHRERHCPTNDELPKCLAPLPDKYQLHVNWPQSRNQVWYANVPHPGLTTYKKDQNWVRKKNDLLIFPGGGTQFKFGVKRYIDFIATSIPEIAWGKRTRVVLDVGCGVASFGGYLFDKNVITLSFAPKDEHEAQVQLALERGIPAMLAVMGTQRLTFPSNSYDAVHCARCRVPWHVEGGKLLLELNRVLRPGGYFLWSATPVYKYEQEDVEIWKETKALADAMCWKLIFQKKDPRTGVGLAVFQKPATNSCYDSRAVNSPTICEDADNADAAWYVPMQTCLHKLPTDGARGSIWPTEWSPRLNATPAWLGTLPKGLFGKPAVDEFQADTEHWSRVIQRSYATGLEIDWSTIRNVMDMKAGYGGFAAALSDYPVWVMNVVPVNEPDTLPIIFDRGLIGVYHDWCESFSTYPRTYDLLHADHLFSGISKRCGGVVNAILEMDRILRPDGWAIFRDTTAMFKDIEPVIKSLHWVIRVTYTQEQEQLLAAQKSFWRPT